MEVISAYSNEELVAALKENGLSVGPLTGTTRRIYEKRLYRKLHPDEADGNAQANGQEPPKEKPNTTLNTIKSEVSEKDNAKPEENVVLSYFAVQLPDTIDEVDGPQGIG